VERLIVAVRDTRPRAAFDRQRGGGHPGRLVALPALSDNAEGRAVLPRRSLIQQYETSAAAAH
jgi:hypothetical protein